MNGSDGSRRGTENKQLPGSARTFKVKKVSPSPRRREISKSGSGVSRSGTIQTSNTLPTSRPPTLMISGWPEPTCTTAQMTGRTFIQMTNLQKVACGRCRFESIRTTNFPTCRKDDPNRESCTLARLRDGTPRPDNDSDTLSARDEDRSLDSPPSTHPPLCQIEGSHTSGPSLQQTRPADSFLDPEYDFDAYVAGALLTQIDGGNEYNAP
jgi:hypothetical protein